MLLMVAQDDIASFKSDNVWLSHHPKEALLFKETEKAWNELENTYLKDFGNLVHGKLPESSEILKTLKIVSERIKDLTWNLDFSNMVDQE